MVWRRKSGNIRKYVAEEGKENGWDGEGTIETGMRIEIRDRVWLEKRNSKKNHHAPDGGM